MQQQVDLLSQVYDVIDNHADGPLTLETLRTALSTAFHHDTTEITEICPGITEISHTTADNPCVTRLIRAIMESDKSQAWDARKDINHWMTAVMHSDDGTITGVITSPFHLAAVRGMTDLVEQYMGHASEQIAEAAVFSAVTEDKASTLQLLVDAHRGRTARGLECISRFDSRLLSAACQNGCASTVSILLAAGSSVHARIASIGHCTPLHMAAQNGHLDVIRQLIAAGANVCASADGLRGGAANSHPLHRAACMGHAEAVRVLLDAGADPQAKCKDGNTAPMLAIGRGRSEVVDVFLQAGAFDADAVLWPGGRTAMHMAAKNGDDDVISVLLRHGARPDTLTQDMVSVVRIAAEAGHTALARQLATIVADRSVKWRPVLHARAVEGLGGLLLDWSEVPCVEIEDPATP